MLISIRATALCIYLCSLCALGAETNSLRSWLTVDGQVSVCQFEKYAKAKVLLKDKDGKSVVIETKNLSVVDRLYLIDEQDVPEKELLEGHKDLVETRIKVPRELLMKKEPVTFPYDGGEITFNVIDTPHFKILSEDRLNPSEVGSYLEKLWFYQAYRNPIFESSLGGLKNTVIISSSKEFIDGLHEWSLPLRGDVSARQRKVHENNKYAGLTGLPMPRDYTLAEGLVGFSYLVRSDEVDFLNEEQFRFTAAYANFILRTHGLSDIFSQLTDQGHLFVYGVGFDAEMTFHGEIGSGFSFDGQGAGAWGESRQWAKAITKAAKKGAFKYSLSDYHKGDQSLIPNPLFGEYVTAVSMFIRSDMSKELGTARYLKLVKTKGAQTTLEEFVSCYGYKDVAEMETALLAYIAKNKVK